MEIAQRNACNPVVQEDFSIDSPVRRALPDQRPMVRQEEPQEDIGIGSGVSGLCLAYKLKNMITDYELTLYEKSPHLAGTWWEIPIQRGLRHSCHVYTYSSGES